MRACKTGETWKRSVNFINANPLGVISFYSFIRCYHWRKLGEFYTESFFLITVLYSAIILNSLKKREEELDIEVSGKELNKIWCIHVVDYHVTRINWRFHLLVRISIRLCWMRKVTFKKMSIIWFYFCEPCPKTAPCMHIIYICMCICIYLHMEKRERFGNEDTH